MPSRPASRPGSQARAPARRADSLESQPVGVPGRAAAAQERRERIARLVATWDVGHSVSLKWKVWDVEDDYDWEVWEGTVVAKVAPGIAIVQWSHGGGLPEGGRRMKFPPSEEIEVDLSACRRKRRSEMTMDRDVAGPEAPAVAVPPPSPFRAETPQRHMEPWPLAPTPPLGLPLSVAAAMGATSAPQVAMAEAPGTVSTTTVVNTVSLVSIAPGIPIQVPPAYALTTQRCWYPHVWVELAGQKGNSAASAFCSWQTSLMTLWADNANKNLPIVSFFKNCYAGMFELWLRAGPPTTTDGWLMGLRLLQLLLTQYLLVDHTMDSVLKWTYEAFGGKQGAVFNYGKWGTLVKRQPHSFRPK